MQEGVLCYLLGSPGDLLLKNPFFLVFSHVFMFFRSFSSFWNHFSFDCPAPLASTQDIKQQPKKAPKIAPSCVWHTVGSWYIIFFFFISLSMCLQVYLFQNTQCKVFIPPQNVQSSRHTFIISRNVLTDTLRNVIYQSLGISQTI